MVEDLMIVLGSFAADDLCAGIYLQDIGDPWMFYKVLGSSGFGGDDTVAPFTRIHTWIYRLSPDYRTDPLSNNLQDTLLPSSTPIFKIHSTRYTSIPKSPVYSTVPKAGSPSSRASLTADHAAMATH